MLEDQYGFGAVQIRERLEGGYWSEVFRVAADGGDYAFRRYHPGAVPAGVPWEHGLTRFLGSTIEQVPVPLRQVDGSTFSVDEGRVVALFPLMRGSRPEESIRGKAWEVWYSASLLRALEGLSTTESIA